LPDFHRRVPVAGSSATTAAPLVDPAEAHSQPVSTQGDPLLPWRIAPWLLPFSPTNTAPKSFV
jgi:hypothetical protein